MYRAQIPWSNYFTHATPFRYSEVIAVLLVARTHDDSGDGDGVAQDGGHTTANRLTETCTHGS